MVGSSRTSRRGRLTSAWASSRRRIIPPSRSTTSRSAASPRPIVSSISATPPARAAGDVEEAGEERDVLAAGQRGVGGELLGHEPEQPAHVHRAGGRRRRRTRAPSPRSPGAGSSGRGSSSSCRRRSGRAARTPRRRRPRGRRRRPRSSRRSGRAGRGSRRPAPVSPRAGLRAGAERRRPPPRRRPARRGRGGRSAASSTCWRRSCQAAMRCSAAGVSTSRTARRSCGSGSRRTSPAATSCCASVLAVLGAMRSSAAASPTLMPERRRTARRRSTWAVASGSSGQSSRARLRSTRCSGPTTASRSAASVAGGGGGGIGDNYIKDRYNDLRREWQDPAWKGMRLMEHSPLALDPFGGRQPTSHERMTGQPWDASYRACPAPWDVGRPQPAVVRLAGAGGSALAVLDAGCGTGENALHLASRGLPVMGVDVAPTAVAIARAKARDRGIEVEFAVADAFELARLGRRFESVLDSGLFHTFAGDERPRYVASLAAATEPGGTLHVVCFSDAAPDTGPHPVSEASCGRRSRPRPAGTRCRRAATDPDEISRRRRSRMGRNDHPQPLGACESTLAANANWPRTQRRLAQSG